jgi:hydrogenase maturation protein HypF
MTTDDDIRRLRIQILGAVQGVGFRPFVYRLATEMELRGWVLNSTRGVLIEVEGDPGRLEELLLRLEREKPPRSSIHSLEHVVLDPVGYEGFKVRKSAPGGLKTAIVLPDIATCSDCLREVFDPQDRRHLYPFTNCTHCGPRYSIIRSLPYDRPATTMRGFEMCRECRREYEDPGDRRFHAQPNACPACGPRLALWGTDGRVEAERHEALLAAGEAIRHGAVVAVKGLGGFHLVVDARNEDAVRNLRVRKRREEKPLALMFPSLEHLREACRVSEAEERLLRSPESPIVLLSRESSGTGPIAPSVAPGNPSLGALLPYTPLHHLLLGELDFPVVATSGNLSDEPICIDEREALGRLSGIADAFLVHDRPIARHVDDSIVRVMAGRELVLRRARGYAPLPVHLTEAAPPLLGVGAHLKSSVALAVGKDVFLSQHIGDLETAEAHTAFRAVIGSLRSLYEAEPEAVACDLHPDYLSTRYARESGLPLHRVQHHHAHVASCMAECELDGTVLGVSWDGTGLGTDGTIWGGEFLLATRSSFERVAHLRTFQLPGGDRAVREPRRSALAVLYEVLGDEAFTLEGVPALEAFSAAELRTLRAMLHSGVNTPVTSSAGRLFDAVASLVGIRQRVRHEGQAAMELEFALSGEECDSRYDIKTVATAENRLCLVDWEPAITGILADVRSGVPAGRISAKFHNALVTCIVEVASRAGQERVVLTGGCFQNKYLTEHAVARLRQEGFRPYWHQRVPPNDGGIALGQVAAAAADLRKQGDYPTHVPRRAR